MGSALTNKVLLRVEGETSASEDDRIIEAKELSNLQGIDCLIVPTSDEVVRVIDGAHQIGRIRHDVLVDVPRRRSRGPETRDWLFVDDLLEAGRQFKERPPAAR